MGPTHQPLIFLSPLLSLTSALFSSLAPPRRRRPSSFARPASPRPPLVLPHARRPSSSPCVRGGCRSQTRWRPGPPSHIYARDSRGGGACHLPPPMDETELRRLSSFVHAITEPCLPTCRRRRGPPPPPPPPSPPRPPPRAPPVWLVCPGLALPASASTSVAALVPSVPGRERGSWATVVVDSMA